MLNTTELYTYNSLNDVKKNPTILTEKKSKLFDKTKVKQLIYKYERSYVPKAAILL